MARKLILLAGLHKTGTTSIQKACANALTELSEYKISYSPIITSGGGNLIFGGNGNHSQMLRWAFRRKPMYDFELKNQSAYEQYSQEFRRQLNQIIEQLDSTHRLVMVAESVSNFTEDELYRLNYFFSKRGLNTDLHCVVRKPKSWVNSFIAQRVVGKSGPRLILKDSIIELHAKGIVRPRIKNLMKVFPDAKFHSLSEAIQNPNGIVGYFSQRILGLDSANILNNKFENTGTSDHAVRINSCINKELGDRHSSQEHYWFYSKFLEKNPLIINIPGRKFHLRESEVAPILPLLIEENQWLKETFGEGFYDEEIKFSNEAVTLNDGERQYLINHFSNVEEPIRSIVKKYISEH